jgi:hypothetical protein
MMHSPITTATVHGEGRSFEASESSSIEVLPRAHRPNDPGEREELSLLAADKRISFEERDDPCQEIVPPAHDVHQRGVSRAAMVLAEAAN